VASKFPGEVQMFHLNTLIQKIDFKK